MLSYSQSAEGHEGITVQVGTHGALDHTLCPLLPQVYSSLSAGPPERLALSLGTGVYHPECALLLPTYIHPEGTWQED